MTEHDDTLPVVSHGAAALRETERADLEHALTKAQGRKSRHALWVLLGISPAAMIPALGLILEGSIALVVVLLVLVSVVEAVRWFQAAAVVSRLEQALYGLDDEEVDPDSAAGGAA